MRGNIRVNSLQFSVVVCAAACILVLFVNLPTLFSNSWFLQRVTLGIIKSGGALGFLGNLIVILAIAYCYGAMAYNGFMILFKGTCHKPALTI